MHDPSSEHYLPRPPKVPWKVWRIIWKEAAHSGRKRGDVPFLISPHVMEGLTPELRADVEKLRLWVEDHQVREQKMGWRIWVFPSLVFLPLLSLAGVFLSGLEQTPLTGRWRMVLISPAEEEAIHEALKEKGYVSFA